MDRLKRKGISLIVLIITIIVVIILASIVILTISKNNPIKSAKEAVFKEDVRNFQNDLSFTISKQYTENRGNRDTKINTQSIPATFDEMKNYISNYKKKYDKKLGIEDDEIVYFPDEVSIDEKKWLEDLGIKPRGENIEEASEDIFIWDANDGTKIIGYHAGRLKEYLSRNNNILKIPEKCKTLEANAFQNCSNIERVIVPNSVTDIGKAVFFNCNNLVSVEIPNTVTKIKNETFENCTNLKNITIPNSVTAIGAWAFGKCSSLTNIEIPNSVYNIGTGAFSYCTSLSSVIMKEGISFIGDAAFNGCVNLKDIIIPESVTYIGSNLDDTLWYKNQKDGIVYINNILYKYKGEMPKNTTISVKDGTKQIAYGAFIECKNLISIIIPNSVTSIEDRAFNRCDNLREIVIPDSVTYLGFYVFEGCSNLEKVVISNNVTSIGFNTFYDCNNLSSVTMSNSVRNIKSYAFSNCSNLSNIIFNGTINEWNNITKASDWKNNSNIQTITCSDGVINLE